MYWPNKPPEVVGLISTWNSFLGHVKRAKNQHSLSASLNEDSTVMDLFHVMPKSPYQMKLGIPGSSWKKPREILRLS